MVLKKLNIQNHYIVFCSFSFIDSNRSLTSALNIYIYNNLQYYN